MRPHKLSREQPNLPEQIAEKSGPFFRTENRPFMIFFRQGRDEQRTVLSAADDEGAILISRIRSERII